MNEHLDRMTVMPDSALAVLKRLVAEYGAGRDCLEIGTWTGNSALALLDAGAARVFCVDAWQGSVDVPNEIIFQPNINPALGMLRFRERMGSLLFDRVFPLVGTSKFWAPWFPDESLALVFIDGSHDYRSVLADARAWWPKVTSGGVLCGDDHSALFPGVCYAVAQFSGGEHSVEDRIWWQCRNL